MLRNMVLGLVLANVLLLAWQSWVVPRDALNPYSLGSSREPQLAAIGETRAAAEQVREETQQCIRLGPFADVDTAESVRQQLEGRDFSVHRTSEIGEIWVGFWVQLGNLETVAEAAVTVDRLIDAGLVDAYVFQTEPTINISLGVFRGRKGADRVAGVARNLGLKPQMTDRFQSGVEHWLTIESVGDPIPSLGDIRITSNRILRTESVPCGGDAVVDARI